MEYTLSISAKPLAAGATKLKGNGNILSKI